MSFYVMKSVGIIATAFLMLSCAESTNSPNPKKSNTHLSQPNVNWPLHGYDFSEKRYSELQAINLSNVDKLGVSWYTDIEAKSLRGVESTPIVIDGIMYVTGPWNLVMALNAVTGEVLWEYDCLLYTSPSPRDS